MKIKLYAGEHYPVYDFDGNPLECTEVYVTEETYWRWKTLVDLHNQVQKEMRDAVRWMEGRSKVALKEEEEGDLDL